MPPGATGRRLCHMSSEPSTESSTESSTEPPAGASAGGPGTPSAYAAPGVAAPHLVVLTTTDSAEQAERLARSAVAARLAACAQIDGPITSVYRWQGEVATDREWRVLYKTTAERYPALEAHISRTHTYDTPEIIAVGITHGSEAYLSWLEAETAPGQD